jgi:hypothetical protein
MPAGEMRHIKSLAAREGLTLREAIHEAFRLWEEQLLTQAGPAGSPRGEPAETAAELPTQTNPAWLRGAARLDWSKCPAVELLQGRNRSVWVVRGTLRSLEDVFDAVANGYPMKEIAETYEITFEQLTAIVLFAAKRVGPGAKR